jgi:hypothetical protein
MRKASPFSDPTALSLCVHALMLSIGS